MPTPSTRAAHRMGMSVLRSLNSHLGDLVLDPKADVKDGDIRAFSATLDACGLLLSAGHGAVSIGYAVAHVPPTRSDEYETQDLTAEFESAQHSLRVLRSLYGPQPATCEGGC